MDRSEARQQLTRVLDSCPSYRDWLGRLKDGEGKPSGSATADSWIGMLLGCDLDDVVTIVDKIVAGEIDPPGLEPFGKPEQMPRMIRREANELRSSRNERQTQTEKYHQPRVGAWSFVTSDSTGRIAVALGEQVKRKEISREVNDERMIELLVWDKGGAKPEWME